MFKISVKIATIFISIILIGYFYKNTQFLVIYNL